MKKFFSAVVALCLVFVMSFSFTASAAADKIVWDDWDIDDVIVYGYLGTDTEVTIPNMDQYRVKLKEVGTSAFREKAGITKIVVANGITTINGACFQEMPDLKEVVFPSSLSSLGYGYNIHKCLSIEKVTLPGALTKVGDGFAAMTKSLKEVVFSYGIQNIGFQSFRQTSLTNVVIPESVEQIESWAFTELQSDEFTITICNPEVILTGGSIDGKERSEDILDLNPNVKITIICPQGSTTEKYYNENGLPGNSESKLETKPQSYFDALAENQSDYGQQEVAPIYAPEGMEDVVHDGTKKFEEESEVSTPVTVSNNSTGNNNTTNDDTDNNNTVTVGSSIDFKGIITGIGIIFASIILIIIIVVVVVVIVRAQKEKKRKAARAARKAAEAAAAAAPDAEVTEPSDAPIDEPETQE